MKRNSMNDVVVALILVILAAAAAASVSGGGDSSSSLTLLYIVHMSKSEMPSDFSHHLQWYESSLRSVSESAEFTYTYDTVLHGFATKLTQTEAESLAGKPGILGVLPQTRYELHTTHSPEFLGLESESGSSSSYSSGSGSSDVIIGVLDTGVWPESKSFDDMGAGLGPVPSRWKGECQLEKREYCNRKLIGARSFYKGFEAAVGGIGMGETNVSPRDIDGHGTHTSSTAAGSSVQGASLFGYASGTARGMATHARVAAYKVCWPGGCFSADILAAMEAAIADGVDVLSISLGGGSSDYYRDSVAIGAFAAMEKGVFVSCSAGNSGPNPYSLSNLAPWIATVGAGTLDRDFPAVVRLGNGHNYNGVSLYDNNSNTNSNTNTGLPDGLIPIVYAGNATNSSNGNLCLTGTLIPEKVSGKIVLCDRGISPRVQKGYVVKSAGGVGMVLANTEENGEELVADAHLLPAVAIGQKMGQEIKSYIINQQQQGTISFEGTKLGIQPSPVVAAFSSRGPNPLTPQILKPDMIAPGVNILASWTGAAGPTGLDVDKRRVSFNIISGTSMSCPHVSGLAALLKAAHPDWTPAAIKSALMTTAYDNNKQDKNKPMLDVATGKPSTPFDHGAGHVDPVAALDPGLVYDLTIHDYLAFLCALGYTDNQVNLVSRTTNFTCSNNNKSYNLGDFNYPSFAVSFPSSTISSTTTTTTKGRLVVVKHTRTLTNVGPPATYMVKATTQDPSLHISVQPDSLHFTKTGDKKSYTVTFTSSSQLDHHVFGRIEWSDGNHIVASPVVFNF